VFDLLSQVLRGAASQFKTNDPLMGSLVSWVSRLQEAAFTKWRVVAASGIRCTGKMHFRQVGAVDCPHPAIGACISCKQALCIGHAFVSVDGVLVCASCVAKLGKAAGPDPSPPTNQEDLRKKHLKVLGLGDDATWDQINDAFRALSKKHHPDRAAPAKRAAAEKKFKTLSESFTWLKEHQQ
jgi:hypothetical protein